MAFYGVFYKIMKEKQGSLGKKYLCYEMDELKNEELKTDKKH